MCSHFVLNCACKSQHLLFFVGFLFKVLKARERPAVNVSFIVVFICLIVNCVTWSLLSCAAVLSLASIIQQESLHNVIRVMSLFVAPTQCFMGSVLVLLITSDSGDKSATRARRESAYNQADISCDNIRSVAPDNLTNPEQLELHNMNIISTLPQNRTPTEDRNCCGILLMFVKSLLGFTTQPQHNGTDVIFDETADHIVRSNNRAPSEEADDVSGNVTNLESLPLRVCKCHAMVTSSLMTSELPSHS